MNMMTELAGRPARRTCCTPRCASPASRSAATASSRSAIPYTGEVVGTVPKATRRRHPPRVRHRHGVQAEADALRALPHPVSRRPRSSAAARDAISDLITAECGICKKDSLYEVGRACDVFVFAGNAALNDDGQIFSCDLTPHGKKRKVYTLREPLLGAITAITPFNHPLNQVAHKVAPSIATNNRMVLKPTREDAAHRAAARRHPLRGGPAAGDVLGRHRRPARDRRRDADQPGHRPRHLHRRRRRSASTSRRRPSTSGRCSSSAATTRSS